MGGDEQVPTGPKTCKQAVTGAIRQHWTVPPKHRTPEQDEAEDHLITFYLGKNRYLNVSNLKFSRWYLFFASFLVQFCIGSLYSWSVLNKPIDKVVYNNEAAEKAVNAFYTAVGVFGTTTAIMGPWIERNGPRAGVCLGTTAFLIGHIICAISLHAESLVGVIIGYGVFCGFGMGLCYISPVSALQKWFPDYRGTAAGFAVGGYGAGAVVWAKVYLPIRDAVGLPNMFLVIGFTMATVMYICAIVLRSPHHDFTVGGLNIHGEAVKELEDALEKGERISVMSAHEYESIKTPTAQKLAEELHEEQASNGMSEVRKLTLIDAIKSIDFVFMYIMFFANQLFGLIVLSKLSPMCVDIFGKSASVGSDIVSINGVFNCCGRLVLPAVSDFFIRTFKLEPAFGRKCIFIYTLISQVIIVGTIPYLIDNKNFTVFVIEVFILTASYGGGFGSIPCFLTDMFGAFNIGAMHGLILTAWSIGGVVGGITFNNAFRHARKVLKKTAADAYVDNINKIFVVVIIGFVFIFLVRTNPKDRFAGGYRFTVFGCTLINIKPKKKEPETTHNGLLVREA